MTTKTVPTVDDIHAAIAEAVGYEGVTWSGVRKAAEAVAALGPARCDVHTATVAWLIEMPERFGPLYFHFEHDDDWTKDHDKAIRFARQADAEQVIAHYGWTRALAVEHMWV